MSELEQLRKELNEMRERVAVLEKRTSSLVPFSYTGSYLVDPLGQYPNKPLFTL